MSRILVYHTVDSYDHVLPAGINCEKSVFASHLEYLASRWKVVSLNELFDSYLSKGKEPPSDVLSITFDDGYKDNYTNAFPLLKEFNLPATIFCVTSQIGEALPEEEWNGVKKSMLDIGSIKEMARHGIDFASHGHSHCPMTELDDDNLRNQLEESAEILKRITGKSSRFLSYPFGSTDSRVKNIVREAGFDGAFTVWKKAPDIFSLNRLPLHNRDRGLRFRFKIKWYDFYKRLTS